MSSRKHLGFVILRFTTKAHDFFMLIFAIKWVSFVFRIKKWNWVWASFNSASLDSTLTVVDALFKASRAGVTVPAGYSPALYASAGAPVSMFALKMFD